MGITEMIADIGRPVILYPKLGRIIGREESLFVAQLIYWLDVIERTESKERWDRWIYKKSEDIEEETGLTYREQLRVRKNLKKSGILIERYEKFENRFYFKIDSKILNDVFEKALLSHLNDARHDVTMGSHDVTMGSHDVTMGSHDVTMGSHDVTMGSHERKSVYIHRVHRDDTGEYEESTGIPPPTSQTRSPSVSVLKKNSKEGELLVAEGFNIFWLAYPTKKGKQAAIKAWSKILPSEYAPIMAALPHHIASEKWREKNGRFINNASTWLNGRLWEDEMGPVQIDTMPAKKYFIAPSTGIKYELDSGGNLIIGSEKWCNPPEVLEKINRQ